MADARFNAQGENPRLYTVLPPVTEVYVAGREGGLRETFRSDDPASMYQLLRWVDFTARDARTGPVAPDRDATVAAAHARRTQRRLRELSETIDITGPGS